MNRRNDTEVKMSADAAAELLAAQRLRVGQQLHVALGVRQRLRLAQHNRAAEPLRHHREARVGLALHRDHLKQVGCSMSRAAGCRLRAAKLQSCI